MVKMKSKTRKIISRSLMGVGLSLLLVVGVYEAVNYPWRSLFTDWGWVAQENVKMPDPKPLPAGATTSGASADPGEVGDGLPNAPGYFTARPLLDVTKLGNIKIPRLGLSENVIEGAGDELFYGVGHVPGTALPGEEGNCVLAGHRNYVIMHPFRHLDKVKVGDSFVVEDEKYAYSYEVFEVLVVEPDDVWVVDPVEGQSHVASLLTCTPVLTFTHRMIVRGKLVGAVPLVV